MRRTAIIAISALLAATACTRSKDAKEILDAEGYTDIRTTGYAAFRCGRDDWSATGFSATSQAGSRVDGVVCCGMTKSCTVRITRVMRP